MQGNNRWRKSALSARSRENLTRGTMRETLPLDD